MTTEHSTANTTGTGTADAGTTAAGTTTTNRTTTTSAGGREAGVAYSPEHAPRLRWAKAAPEVYKAMAQLDAAARQGVDPVLLELVKIRASQINHCALCLDMHTKDALAAGESVERIVQLSAWEESQHFYTPKEVAAIELAEAVTVLTDGFVPDEVYEKAAAHFDETELAHLIAAITVINAWNRLGVTTRAVPGHYRPGQFA